jgi:WD40 repeat protein
MNYYLILFISMLNTGLFGAHFDPADVRDPMVYYARCTFFGWLPNDIKGILAQQLIYTYPTLFPPSQVLSGHASKTTASALSGDGSCALTGAADGVVLLWDATNPARLTSRVAFFHTREISAVAITPDAQWGLTGSCDSTACLLDLRNPEAIRPYIMRGHAGKISGA